MDEEENRLAKPLARSREITSADSAEGGAVTSHPPDPEALDSRAQSTTPENPPRNHPRRAVVNDGPSPEDVAAQLALDGNQDTNPTRQKSKATRAISLDEVDSELMADAPAALPGGELRVRQVRPQRTLQRISTTILVSSGSITVVFSGITPFSLSTTILVSSGSITVFFSGITPSSISIYKKRINIGTF